ncbi:chlorohydrolase [Streptococcus pneumoniae]|nr:chlorohydrolase [Streptococcus pneumoniae]
MVFRLGVNNWGSMKIKEQTRKLAAGCSKHRFEVVDRTDEVSSKHRFEVVDRTDEVSSKHGFEVVDRTDEVSNIYTAR